jgi:hypothetical protein
MQEDPLLLNSIRRGDFQKGGGNESTLVQYEDSRGNPISDDEMEKLADKSGKDIRAIGKQAKELFEALPLVDSHMMRDDEVHHANTGAPNAQGYLDSPVYRPLKRLDRLCLLCESLAGGGELSTVPACAGMSCGTGAWRDSDASRLYDERTLKVALHPPTDDLKKKDVLERARFPEADPEPNEGLGSYGFTESTAPAVPVHSMFKARGATELAVQGHVPSAARARSRGQQVRAPVSLKATTVAARMTVSSAAGERGDGGGGKGVHRHGVGTGQAAGGAVAHSLLGRALSKEETRALACEYAATTRVTQHIPILQHLFKAKYNEPLRCTGRERRPAARPRPRAVLQKKWEWSGSWENGTWVPDEEDEDEDEGEDEGKGDEEEGEEEGEDEDEGKEEAGNEDEGAGDADGEKEAKAKDGGRPEEEEKAGDVQEGGGPKEEQSVYLYVGRDAQPAFQYKMEDILSKQVPPLGPNPFHELFPSCHKPKT